MARQDKILFYKQLITVNIMPDCYGVEKSITTEDLISTAYADYADASVKEVFSMMSGINIERIKAPKYESALCGLDEMTAIVGISGSRRGSFQIRISSSAARTIASAMLGGEHIDENDGSIDDALGEICNMIAGGWKNSILVFSGCTMSPPTVVSGQNYKVHFHKPSLQLVRTYMFSEHTLSLVVYIE